MTAPTPSQAPTEKKARPKWKKVALIALGVVAVLIVIGAIVGPKKTADTASSPTPASSSATSSAAEATTSVAETSTSATIASTTTSAVRSTATSATYEPIPAEHFEGTGDDVITLAKAAGPALLTFSCPDCQHNVVVDTKADLLVNEIGSYSGTHLIDTSTRSGPTSTVEITADGSWTLDIADITTAPEATSGAGDSVIWVKTGNKVAITHDGEHNFVVEAIGVSGGDLLVNEIGPYQGTKAVDTPVIVDITADGNWTITPS